MRLRRCAAMMVALALLWAWPASAQEQRGVIEGIVKDSSGAILPGAAVEAKSPAGAVLNTVSDANGVFRFPSVAPGIYEVTATLSGFSPANIKDVPVALGQVKRVELALAIAGVTDTVTVTSESPLVDVKQTARQTNIRAEQVELMPHGRDFTSLVTQAPGANQESKLGGLSIDGASAGENRYIVDGIETTNLKTGVSGKNVIADFVEEVQVKSSGYTAEYGGATGGVVNVLTKSGTNDFRGTALFNVQGSALQGGRRPSLRLNLSDSFVSEYITYPEDDETRIEPGFGIGGPIARNRAWFFAAYQPALTNTTRDVSPASAGNPNASSTSVEQKAEVQYLTASQTAQISDSLRTRLAFNNSWSKTEGLLPSLTGTDPLGTNYGKTSTFPNYSISGNLDWVTSPRLFFGLRGGYYKSDQYDTNVTEEPLFRWTNTSNVGLAGVPADLQRGSGFTSIPSNNKVDRDQQTRLYFQADGTFYGNLAGQHQLKFGVQADRVGNNVLSGESRNRVSIFWDTSLSTGAPFTRGSYGYYSVRSNGVDPLKGFITEGDIHTTNIGLFIQDSWTIANRLTINAGIRTERERVPTYTTGTDIPEFGLEFDFADKLAPRIGASYDLSGDGRTKLFGSWGVFYDIFKLELPRGSFGGDKWLEYYYTLDTPNWPTLVDNSGCPPACSGTLIRGPIDFRHPSFGSDSIDPDLKPMRQQEATAGIEHQLNDVVAVSVRYVHKQIDRAIEDTGSLDAQGNEIYVIANPGESLTALAYTGVALPKPQRDYDSVEFVGEKRYRDNWSLRASYMWSRLYGNYSGLSQSDENGRTSPNVGRLYDYPLMMFMDGGVPALGPLATDRPHQFKAQGIYTAPFGTSLGVFEYMASGLPVSRELGIFPTSNLPVQYLGRGSDGRTDVYSQTDIQLAHNFRLGGQRAFQVNFTVFNLFNQEAGISKYSTYQKTNGVIPNEALFYSGQQTLEGLIGAQNVVQDPRFLMVNGYQAPISARFGVKFLF